MLIKANRENATQLQRILELYERVSGQTINKDKSTMLFSANARESDHDEVKGILQIAKETMNDRYLGLPI